MRTPSPRDQLAGESGSRTSGRGSQPRRWRAAGVRTAWIVAAALLMAWTSGCGRDGEPQNVTLCPGVELHPAAEWKVEPLETGGYALVHADGVRLAKMEVVAFDEGVGGTSPPWISQPNGRALAKYYRDVVIERTKLPGLYKPFFEGYQYDGFDTLEVDGRTWGLLSARRAGKKIQYWATLFTHVGGRYVVGTVFYDADATGGGVPPRAFEDLLRQIVITAAAA